MIPIPQAQINEIVSLVSLKVQYHATKIQWEKCFYVLPLKHPF